MITYRRFVRDNIKFLGFGLLLTLASNFGQTFFISIFSGDIRAEFGLTHGSFGAIYSSATLLSAAVLVWSGKLIDTTPLRPYSLVVIILFAAACLLMSFSTGPILLFIAIFFLRQCGQGLMGHISSTSMAAYFHRERGRALSLTSLGYPIGEAIFPLMGVFCIGAFGWRTSWQIYAVVIIVILPLGISYLLGSFRRRDQVNKDNKPQADLPTDTSPRHWTRGQVLRDPAFYLAMPLMLASSFLFTGFFFHQVHIAEIKDWSLPLLAASYGAFAVFQTISSLLAGWVIDKKGSLFILPWLEVPMFAALCIMGFADGNWTIWAYMGLGGLTAGANATVSGAIWAEVYGTRHLGALKSLSVASMVFASGLSPVLIGTLFDWQFSLASIVTMALGYILFATLLAFIAVRRFYCDVPKLLC